MYAGQKGLNLKRGEVKVLDPKRGGWKVLGTKKKGKRSSDVQKGGKIANFKTLRQPASKSERKLIAGFALFIGCYKWPNTTKGTSCILFWTNWDCCITLQKIEQAFQWY